ncbi:MAG: UPF0280 family protein [Candidatus Thorarchaeota archaeon]|jgi:ApbE superfamily uncharacterized protein (UPF0280 family)
MKKETLIKQTYGYKETRGIIIADNQKAVSAAKLAMQEHRNQLERYILQNPLFLYSLEPISVGRAPKVVKRMTQTSKAAGVGPMAAVAGVLADLSVEAMIRCGAKVAIVEDGGEASAVSDLPIDVALSAGHSFLSKRIGFRLEHFPIGVATSSGKFSHALSFGDAEAVTIFAGDAGLADAAATAVGNVIRGDDQDEAIKRGIHKAMSIEGVSGVFILYGQKVGQAGEIPRLIGIQES